MTLIRIAQVVPYDAIGGVEIAARSLLARRDLPCEFDLLFLAGPRPVAEPGLVVSRFRAAVNPLAWLWALRQILKLDPDVLICSLWSSVPACVVARLLHPRIRLVFFLHAEITTHRLDALFSGFGIRAADAVWSDSLRTLELRRAPARKPRRVISFVTDRLQPAERTGAPGLRFVFWGRLAHQKGIDRALLLIALLAARGLDPSFTVYGPDDGEQTTLRRMANELGIAVRVAFPGPIARDRLPAIAAQADFFLQLSRFEGMSMAVVEAMQLGLIPVATPVGEVGRYVKGGENGVMVDAEALDSAADALASLSADPQRLDRLRANAIGEWQRAPLYADDLCAAALALAPARSAALGKA